MVLDKMAAILFKTEHCWKTDCHWKTEQRATIGIPNASGIPAPTVIMLLISTLESVQQLYSRHSVTGHSVTGNIQLADFF